MGHNRTRDVRKKTMSRRRKELKRLSERGQASRQTGGQKSIKSSAEAKG